MQGLDPPFTYGAWEVWQRSAKRPFTQAPIGANSGHIRARCARLSKLWTPERTLRMFRKPPEAMEEGSGDDSSDPSLFPRGLSRRCRPRLGHSNTSRRGDIWIPKQPELLIAPRP